MQIPPTRSISRATTVAKIGRPMKKLTIVYLDRRTGDRRRLVVDHGVGFGSTCEPAPAPSGLSCGRVVAGPATPPAPAPGAPDGLRRPSGEDRVLTVIPERTSC